MLHSGGSPFKSVFNFTPYLGTGNAGGVYLNTATITELADVDNYFEPQVNELNYDYLPFRVFQEYKFTLIRNSLNNASSNIQHVRLVEQDRRTTNSPDEEIMEVYNSIDGVLTPSPVLYTPVDGTGGSGIIDGLGIEVFVSGGTRSLSGSILIGIQAT
jgi:hypothetical protein